MKPIKIPKPPILTRDLFLLPFSMLSLKLKAPNFLINGIDLIVKKQKSINL